MVMLKSAFLLLAFAHVFVLVWISGTHSVQQVRRSINPYRREARRNLSAWRSSLFARTQRFYLAKGGKEGLHHERFELFEPNIICPPGSTLNKYGQGDGQKWACSSFLTRQDCIVYSMGSRNEYSFELDILHRTNCSVFTFDCTVNGTVLGPRHHFIKVCLGNERMGLRHPNIKTLQQIYQGLGHQFIDVLKMDIEGFEYDVLSSWAESDNLPKQIIFELHWHGIYVGGKAYFTNAEVQRDLSLLMWTKPAVSTLDMSLFHLHLANLGYGIAHKENNPHCGVCAEFVLMLVDPRRP